MGDNSGGANRLVVGITGASGAIYAQRFLVHACRQFDKVHLIMSEQARQVAETELQIVFSSACFETAQWLGQSFDNLELLGESDYFTPPASGSYVHAGMVIVPCSMGTIGRIANGISNDLMTRAADVCLKEGRRLILVPREMPYSLIMLRNMTALKEAGATILPASPAWYARPKSLEELADTVVARILQQLGCDQKLQASWMSDDAGGDPAQ